MNHIFSYATSVPQYFASAFTDSLLPQLSTEQKKILAISSIAIGIFTAIIIAYRCYAMRNSGGYVPHNFSPSSPKKYSPKNSSPLVNPSLIKSPSAKFWAQPGPFNLSPRQSSPSVNIFGGHTGGNINSSSFTHSQQPSNPVIKPITQPYQSPALKSGLSAVEDKIKQLEEELAFQRQISLLANSTPLKVKNNNQSSDTQDDFGLELDIADQNLTDIAQGEGGMSEAELRVFELEEELKAVLTTYPEMVCEYLKDKFSGYSQKDTQEIYMHLALLSGIMDNNADNHDFIYDSLLQIDTFLTEAFFTSTTELCLQETKKIDLAVFHEFFPIANKHLPVIKNKDPQLTLNLKVKLANLPLRDEIKKDDEGNPIYHSSTHLPVIDKITDRKQKFPNVHLTEQEQLGILVNHLQAEEEKHLANIIQNLYKKFSTKDVKKLSRLASNKQSSLSSVNKLDLQKALKNHMGSQAPANWDDFDKVQTSLSKFFNSMQSSNPYGGHNYSYYSEDNADILNLHRASKAKQYFAKQVGLPDDKVQIPRWYHATKYCNVTSIINSGQVNVEHKQAFRGAWVSSQRETGFGDSVFVFNHRITKLDPNVFIGYEKITERWRGMQCAIPLLDSSKTPIPYVSLMGIYQGVSKAEKLKVAQGLQKKGVANAVVVSVNLVDYIQKVVIMVLGSPDLSERWWGSADFNKLEKPFNQQQYNVI